MLLHGINYNILIYYLSYLGVYQDETKMRALQRNKYFGGVDTNTKKLTKRRCKFIL